MIQPVRLALTLLLFLLGAQAAIAAPLAVPFDFSRHEIGLNVTVKGKPLYMILDTGVKPSVVDLRDAEVLKLPLNRLAAGQGGGESGRGQESIPSRIQHLAIGGRSFGNIEALATDLRDMSKSFGRPLGGVLGYSFIEANTILIDYPARTVTFYDNAAAADAVLHACRMHDAVPFVSFGDEGFPVLRNFRIGKTMLPTTLDTGSGRAVGLYRQALRLKDIRNAVAIQGREEGNSFGGRYTTQEGTLKVTVGIGPFEALAGMPVSVMPEEGSASTRLAKIGNRLLDSLKVRLLLDYTGKRIAFFGDCGR